MEEDQVSLQSTCSSKQRPSRRGETRPVQTHLSVSPVSVLPVCLSSVSKTPCEKLISKGSLSIGSSASLPVQTGSRDIMPMLNAKILYPGEMSSSCCTCGWSLQVCLTLCVFQALCRAARSSVACWSTPTPSAATPTTCKIPDTPVLTCTHLHTPVITCTHLYSPVHTCTVKPCHNEGLCFRDCYTEKCVMNNYFGIGLDAKISLDFNNKRDEHPEKCRCSKRQRTL